MKRIIPLAALALLLVGLALSMQRRSAPAPPIDAELELDSPGVPAAEPAGASLALEPDAASPPPSRAEWIAYLEKLGRALLLKDARTQQSLVAARPRFTAGDVPWLVSQAKSSELYVALAAIDLLARFGRMEAVPALREQLEGAPSIFVQDACVEALGTLGGPVAAQALLDALVGGLDGSVRARAALALARFEAPETYYALIRAMQSDRDASVRQAAAEALARVSSQDTVGLFLEQLAVEPDVEVQRRVLAAALDRGGRAAIPTLRRMVEDRPRLRHALTQEIKRRGPARYHRSYGVDFFLPSSAAIPWTPTCRRIGLTIDVGADRHVSLASLASAIFGEPPLDRYRRFFYLRRADEFEDDIRAGHPAPRAYDADGLPIAPGIAANELDATVFLHVRDPGSFMPGVLGYTEGNDAHVTPVSMMHEIGHALARLGDEYSSPHASKQEAANLELRDRTPRWKPLVDQGHLPAPQPRVERDGAGVDRGAYQTPGAPCRMNNRPSDDRFCAVCQLQIIARIAELTGADLPW